MSEQTWPETRRAWWRLKIAFCEWRMERANRKAFLLRRQYGILLNQEPKP